MERFIFDDKGALGAAAAARAAEDIRRALHARGVANIILATGASQFATLERLAAAEVDWARVNVFHLDEYIGLPVSHPASFRRYLQERFVAKAPALKSMNFVQGDAQDVAAECRRLGDLIRRHPIDVALVGIGENGHLAFNDPPADMTTEEPYIVVTLDEACRRQQLGEGWFPNLDAVPRYAISMSVRQILKSQSIVASVPDLRKAQAVRDTFLEEISPLIPAAILRTHPDCAIYLDREAASLL